jgi:hypothetical protein
MMSGGAAFVLYEESIIISDVIPWMYLVDISVSLERHFSFSAVFFLLIFFLEVGLARKTKRGLNNQFCFLV